MAPQDIYAPCPCGSGKKYKFCCREKDRDTSVIADMEWVRVRRTEGELIERLSAFAKAAFGAGSLADAWSDFNFGDDVPMDSPDLEATFLPWFCFNWLSRGSKTIAHLYLEKNESKLTPYQKRFIHTITQRPYSFYLVEEAIPGISLSLRGLLVPEEFTVKERRASQAVKRGHILYTRVLPLDGQTIMVGTSPYAFRPNYHYHILDFRDSLIQRGGPLGFDSLQKWAVEIRRFYLELADDYMNPELPTLTNTDGDPLVLAEVRYDLKCPVKEAFHELKGLSWETEEEILQGAGFDEQGTLDQIKFGWMKRGNRVNKDWKHTVLGHIKISGAQLTINVNSAKRASAIKREVDARLGDKAVFKTTVFDSIEHRLKNNEPHRQPDESQNDQQALLQLPEVQAQIKKMTDKHWTNWFDEPIPALKGKTPRQAAKTYEGRERLEALLLEYESHELGDASKGNFLRPDIASLREELGLPMRSFVNKPEAD